MKLENPSSSRSRSDELINDYFEKEICGLFFKKADDRYFYWDELKHRKKIPYNDSTLKRGV